MWFEWFVDTSLISTAWPALVLYFVVARSFQELGQYEQLEVAKIFLARIVEKYPDFKRSSDLCDYGAEKQEVLLAAVREF